MELNYIHEFLKAILREVSRKRVLAVIAFILATLVVAGIGIIWPQKFITNATLYVDQRNIIEPLLEGKAEIQAVDQAQEAKERIYTRKILEIVARDAGLISEKSDSREIAAVLAQLGAGARGGGKGIQINNDGRNYLQLSYADENPEVSFNVVTALINAFIRNIAESKRSQSKEAYDFIQGQVDSYRVQLKKAEEKLKKFQAKNRDGTETSVNDRINSLRAEIEELGLSISEINSRKETLIKQIRKENQYLYVRSQADVYKQRLSELESRLESLLISLTETHPDIINLKIQIQELKQTIIDVESQNTTASSQQTQQAINPLYDQLRSNLSETTITLNAAVNRKKTLENLLKEEYSRSQRIAARRAELTELNRDYSVTQKLYEEMLGSREKARLSMTLEVEGQGTSYKVHEPPTFPIKASGLTVKHFFLLAPIIGILFPIGIIGILIFLDPRIRLPSDLLLIEKCEVLAISSPVKNATSLYLLRKDNIISAALLSTFLIIYLWIVLPRLTGGI